MSEAEYGKAYEAECQKYFAAAKKMSETPWPKLGGLSREERLKVLSQRARGDEKILKDLADDFRKLKPPSSHASLHAAYQEFLDGQVRIQDAYASAIAAGNSEETAKQNKAFEDFLLKQIEVVLQETEKLGGDVSKMRDSLAGLAKGKG